MVHSVKFEEIDTYLTPGEPCCDAVHPFERQESHSDPGPDRHSAKLAKQSSQVEPLEARDAWNAVTPSVSSKPASNPSRRSLLSPEEEAKQGMAYFLSTRKRVVTVERDSSYGSIIVIPQIARSSGWPLPMLTATGRQLVFFILSVFLQSLLLHELGRAMLVIDAYGGKMNLCKFGRHWETCEGALDTTDCIGPGGKEYTRRNLIGDFDIWSVRKFVRDALIGTFPEHRDAIIENMDIGEYGIESNTLHIICVCIFCFSMTKEAQNIQSLVELLLYLPSKDQDGDSTLWVGLTDSEPMDVAFRINGIPMPWKIAYAFGVVVPKTVLWIWMLITGVHFMFEQASIEETILNNVALNFILDIDELIFDVACADTIKDIMQRIEDYTPEKHKINLSRRRSKVFNATVLVQSKLKEKWERLLDIVPFTTILTIILIVCAINGYYSVNCITAEDGSIRGGTLHPPTGVTNLFGIVFGTTSREYKATWAMPADE